MKYIVTPLLVSLVFNGVVYAQKNPIDADYVASQTSYFTIDDNRVTGEGAVQLNAMISKSQFVILGESHGSSQTSKLTSALLPQLRKAGFQHFALEVGPYSAKKLMDLAKPAKHTVQSMYKFNTQYYFPELDDVSIPFFDGIEDAKFLQTASENNFQLWGLDQEYYSSIFYQTDELLKLAENKPNFESIKKTKIEADTVMRKWYIKDEESDTGIDLFQAMLKEPAVIEFFGCFDNDDKEALRLIEDIYFSWDIYSRWRAGSHDDRISNLRNNFMKNYKRFSKSGQQPKVLLKFGRLHAPKIQSGGCYDIGHLIEELAQQNGTTATNVSLLNRYYKSGGKVTDNLADSGNIYYQRVKPFLQQGRKDQFAFINLNSIKADVAAGKVQIPNDGRYHSFKKLLDGFNCQIVLPLDQPVARNFEQK